jgi:hypothetical protein
MHAEVMVELIGTAMARNQLHSSDTGNCDLRCAYCHSSCRGAELNIIMNRNIILDYPFSTRMIYPYAMLKEAIGFVSI